MEREDEDAASIELVLSPFGRTCDPERDIGVEEVIGTEIEEEEVVVEEEAEAEVETEPEAEQATIPLRDNSDDF